MINEINHVLNIVNLNIKYLIFNYNKIWMLMTMFAFSILIPLIFVPLMYSFDLVAFIGIIMPASIIYISTTYNWRSGTLNNNYRTSNGSKHHFYFGSYISMNLYVMLKAILLLITLFVLNEFGWLMTGWRGGVLESEYLIFQINYSVLFYSLFEITLVMFAVLFLIQNIVENSISMYIIVFIIAIFGICFGGAIDYSFNQTFLADSDGNKIITTLKYKGNVYGESLYYPIALAFPFFGPLQHLSSIRWDLRSDTQTFMVEVMTWHSRYWDSWTAWHWDILWFLPYLHTILFATISILISKRKQ